MSATEEPVLNHEAACRLAAVAWNLWFRRRLTVRQVADLLGLSAEQIGRLLWAADDEEQR
jgi:hypothetical protein